MQIDLDKLKANFLLTDKNGEEVEWGINHFPDGQLQFWIEKFFRNCRLTCSTPDSASLDLFWQIMDTVSPINVNILYFYGARSDKYSAGSRIVANVFAQICDDLRYWAEVNETRFTFLSPHAWPQNLGPVDYYVPAEVYEQGYDTWVFPDQSAYNRFGDQLPESVRPIIFKKQRDQETGDIIRHTVAWPNMFEANKVLVIDDLCDGGRTFLDVANVLYGRTEAKSVWAGAGAKLDLYVTHGVFSGNACKNLSDQYDNIFVTDSLKHVRELAKDWPKLKVTNVWGGK